MENFLRNSTRLGRKLNIQFSSSKFRTSNWLAAFRTGVHNRCESICVETFNWNFVFWKMFSKNQISMLYEWLCERIPANGFCWRHLQMETIWAAFCNLFWTAGVTSKFAVRTAKGSLERSPKCFEFQNDFVKVRRIRWNSSAWRRMVGRFDGKTARWQLAVIWPLNAWNWPSERRHCDS